MFKGFYSFLVLFFLAFLMPAKAVSTNIGACQNKPRHRLHQNDSTINLVFTSDAHYGITRKNFRGNTDVAAHVVNAAMIGQINTLPGFNLPADGGINAGYKVGPVDYFVQTGDITNRMEPPVQTAAASWAQFETDYINTVSLKGHNGQPAKLLLAPGNHDISNAVGFVKPMMPLTDPTSMVKIYNMMLKPVVALTNADYNYVVDKINYSLNVKGIHLQFITLWPDSAERIWMQRDLDTVSQTTPVIIFTHDEPTCEAKHFTNPTPPYELSATKKFENLTVEHYKEGDTILRGEKNTDIEQRGWVKFLKSHPNIKAYFHGNSNWNEFYVYKGPDNDVSLNTFRVDSPMKGKYSGEDEKLLSFQLISVDPQTQNLTVRECLWNTQPLNTTQPIVFGKSITVSLKVN